MSRLEVGPFTAALRGVLESDLDGALGGGDLARVVARARELAPDFVSTEMEEASRALAPVVRIRRSSPELRLEPFASAYQKRAGGGLRERSLTPIPSLRAATSTTRWGPMVAVAAVALVVVGLASLSRVVGQVDRAVPVEAERSRIADAPEVATPGRGRTRLGSEGGTVARPELATVDAEEPEGSEGGDREELVSEKRLAELDGQAQAAWRKGQIKAAERLLNELVRVGDRQSKVELAFGDLFSIAHRRGDARAQRRYWKKYLRRFPRGRFADDARAGLCRAGGGSAACWRRYLTRHPNGTHRREAQAVVPRGR